MALFLSFLTCVLAVIRWCMQFTHLGTLVWLQQRPQGLMAMRRSSAMRCWPVVSTPSTHAAPPHVDSRTHEQGGVSSGDRFIPLALNDRSQHERSIPVLHSHNAAHTHTHTHTHRRRDHRQYGAIQPSTHGQRIQCECASLSTSQIHTHTHTHTHAIRYCFRALFVKRERMQLILRSRR